MKYPIIFMRSINAKNIIFKYTSGLKICLALTGDCPLRTAITLEYTFCREDFNKKWKGIFRPILIQAQEVN